MDSIRVIVADGDPVDAELIRSHLESLGYAVDCASDADHAIALAATREYQVLLLDVHMPVSSGVEVMRRLHLITGRPLGVIAIAPDRLASRRAELARMGVDGYVTKPIDLKALEQALNRVLRTSNQ